jgi:hypothetical protein
VAAALGREREPAILGRLLAIAGRLAVPTLLPLVEREADHADGRVRAAALLARVRLAGTGPAELDQMLRPSASARRPAEPPSSDQTANALRVAALDASPRVRRAAALAAALDRPLAAADLLETLSADADPAVRRMAAACGASLAEPPDRLLRRLGNDDDASVRRGALRALRAEPSLAALAPADRRRALREAKAPREVERPPAREGPDPLPLIERELRSTLRGKTPTELAAALGLPPDAIEGAVARGLAEARLARRGPRIFPG